MSPTAVWNRFCNRIWIKKQHQNKAKVFVGLSGGVDSSVSAALLLQQGYEVVGVYIKGWYPDFIECNWKSERRDAMRVAAKLGIPFLTCDAEKEYKQFVIDYFVAEYKAGRTPNPDIMCNRYVKFGAFFKFAMEQGADFVATGHYARVVDGALLKGLDENKDQSYFLWGVDKELFKKILFPVGQLKKPEVRKLATRFDLITASKKDSQGICFLGNIDLVEFLEKFITQKRGKVLTVSGEEIGWHNGAWFFTIGERHGFTISQKGANDHPMFVVKKDVVKNEIVVADILADKKAEVIGVGLREENWISELKVNKTYEARWRYRQDLIKVKFDGQKIVFEDKQSFVPEGQSLVVYDGSNCLGGGIIDLVYSA